MSRKGIVTRAAIICFAFAAAFFALAVVGLFRSYEIARADMYKTPAGGVPPAGAFRFIDEAMKKGIPPAEMFAAIVDAFDRKSPDGVPSVAAYEIASAYLGAERDPAGAFEILKKHRAAPDARAAIHLLAERLMAVEAVAAAPEMDIVITFIFEETESK